MCPCAQELKPLKNSRKPKQVAQRKMCGGGGRVEMRHGRQEKPEKTGAKAGMKRLAVTLNGSRKEKTASGDKA